MISYELDENAGVLTVRPEGKLESQDFQTLSKVVDPFIEERGRLNGIVIVTERFPGWEDFNGMIEHMKFAKEMNVPNPVQVENGDIVKLFPGTQIMGFEVDEKLCENLNTKTETGFKFFPVAL